MGLEGVGADSAARIQNMLLVYSTGFHEIIKDVARMAGDNPQQVIANVWKVFVFLLGDCQINGPY